jgi:hypothetical protein
VFFLVFQAGFRPAARVRAKEMIENRPELVAAVRLLPEGAQGHQAPQNLTVEVANLTLSAVIGPTP